MIYNQIEDTPDVGGIEEPETEPDSSDKEIDEFGKPEETNIDENPSSDEDTEL